MLCSFLNLKPISFQVSSHSCLFFPKFLHPCDGLLKSTLSFHQTHLLHLNPHFSFKVNGVPGLVFQLARSVRQGCPLAPYLFILATDVLGYMLANPKHGVEGLTLPRGGLIRDQTFADDTPLYLQGSLANLDRAQEVLRIFCRALGAKVNWKKSAVI